MKQNYFSDVRSIFNRADIIKRFIYINAIVFIVIKIAWLCFFLIDSYPTSFDPLNWFGFPASFGKYLHKPWTILTYMFYHEGFFHILSNMLFFYFAGKIFVEYLGTKRMIFTYLFGGFAGAILYMLCYSIFPVFNKLHNYSVAIGASASAFAVFITIASYVPNYMVNLFLFGRVRLKTIAIISVLIDLLLISDSNSGGHITHLGGAFFGFVFANQLKKGRDISVPFSSFFLSIKSFFSIKRKSNLKVAYSKYQKKDSLTKQQQIDVILDKIAKSGYESLSKQEKDDLFNLSK